MLLAVLIGPSARPGWSHILLQRSNAQVNRDGGPYVNPFFVTGFWGRPEHQRDLLPAAVGKKRLSFELPVRSTWWNPFPRNLPSRWWPRPAVKWFGRAPVGDQPPTSGDQRRSVYFQPGHGESEHQQIVPVVGTVRRISRVLTLEKEFEFFEVYKTTLRDMGELADIIGLEFDQR